MRDNGLWIAELEGPSYVHQPMFFILRTPYPLDNSSSFLSKVTASIGLQKEGRKETEIDKSENQKVGDPLAQTIQNPV